MKLVCKSCSDRECKKTIDGRQLTDNEIEDVSCDFGFESDFFIVDDEEEDIFIDRRDMLNEVDLHGNLYV